DDRAFRGHMLRHARELFAALESLPEEFTIGTAKEQGRTARTSTLDEVNALLDKTGLARVGWRVPQDVAIAHADEIDDQLEDAVVVLAPIVKIAEGARDKRQETLPQGVTNLDTKASIEKGARVQVMDGPFAGKVGTVQDLDGKGGARVMLGLLAAHLDVKDLSVTTSRRPVLGSSHRRPLSTNKRS
ncbi:MAG TPA: KOW motif-containing protein, partial [Polyangiaceae bacterium]